jgi:uncharacterized DUF497 family protein
MDITYRLQGVLFEWDENKAQINIQKHDVTFEEAAEAFFDPFYQTGDASVNDEERDFIIGYPCHEPHPARRAEPAWLRAGP